MRTFNIKPKEVKRKWYLIDASKASIGRVATAAASLLMGKHKPSQTPHIDGGDYVVVINSDNLVSTGNKSLGKLYYRHSGYPGGLRQKTLRDVAAKNSPVVIRRAVRGMLPDNKLRRGRLNRLKIYTGNEHPHEGQSLEQIATPERSNK
jgi:large subunit ribosomal protein L13